MVARITLFVMLTTRGSSRRKDSMSLVNGGVPPTLRWASRLATLANAEAQEAGYLGMRFLVAVCACDAVLIYDDADGMYHEVPELQNHEQVTLFSVIELVGQMKRHMTPQFGGECAS